MKQLNITGYNLILKDDFLFFIHKESTGLTYKKYNLANDQTEQLEVSSFLQEIYGTDHKKLSNQLIKNIVDYSYSVSNQTGYKYFQNFDEGILYTFDENANLKEQSNLSEIYDNGHAIYSIAWDDLGSLWLAFPSGQTISQFSLDEKKEIFKLGDYTFDKPTGELAYPEDLSYYDGKIYSANMGSGKIVTIDVKTKEVQVLKQDPGKIWEVEINNKYWIYRTEEQIVVETI